MKKTSIIYWASTTLIVLFEGVLPALTSNTPIAIEGVRHLGYPGYFRVMLTLFKVMGAAVLIIPAIGGRFKEWAYAGFGFTFVAASVSHGAVDGFGFQSLFPLILFCILGVSYFFYHQKLHAVSLNN